MTEFDPEIDVRRLRLAPGDVVILTIPDRSTREFAESAVRTLKSALGSAGHSEIPVAVKFQEMGIEVLGPNEPGAMTTTGGGAPAHNR